jgi:hypothetical protein
MLKGFAPVAARSGDEVSVATGIGIGLHSREVAGGCRPCVFRAPFIKPVRTLENGVDAPALATLRARASLRSAAH